MLVSDILCTLPAPLEWMVLFNLAAIRPMADETTIRAMYHLPEDLNLSPYSHVVLANTGRFLACADQSRLVEATTRRGWTRDRIRQSLADRFADRLALFAVDEADCLGLGQSGDYPPVLLHVKIQDGQGQAQAVFAQEPSRQHYELLQAVGVKFVGGTPHDTYYLAQFQNRLPVHIHTGFLSHFSRTAHCNLFFLQHGQIDPPLEAGLISASNVRVRWAHQRSATTLAGLAEAACRESMAMVCQPPPPNQPFDYGDLVPLGFVLRALNETVAIAPSQDGDGVASSGTGANPWDTVRQAQHTLSQFLLSHQHDHLWAFQTNRLVTATDSALVLLGFQGVNQSDVPSNVMESILALECFADGAGGYYPQRWSTEQQPGKMVFDESCRHWCQTDYATTCLVRALQQAAGLDVKTPTEFLAAGLANRSGLYFANPYLVDWLLSCAIGQDSSAADLRQQLLEDVLASMNEDFSFGTYDMGLSTALAILTLVNLGYRGRILRAAQLRLLGFMDHQGLYPTSIPFYSSLRIDHEIPAINLLGLSLFNSFARQTTPTSASDLPQRQIRRIHEQHHAISLYQDRHCLISTALAVLALSESCDPTHDDLTPTEYARAIEPHPRYRCTTHCDYIAQFALRPYIPEGEAVLV